MKSFRKPWCSILFLQSILTFVMAVQLHAKPGFPVFGYLPMYDSAGPYGDPINLNDTAKFPWDRMTHVVEAFAQPSATGTISFPIPQRANLVLKAHQNNTRCMLSVGGAGSSNPNWTSAVSAANRANFVTNLVNATNLYGYDGIDIDWEFPQPSDMANFTAFMVSLGTALHGTAISCGGCAFDGPTYKKQLTFFGSPGADICGVDWDNAGLQGAVDYCIYGAYDFNAPPGYNSPLSTSWLQTGCTGISMDYCITQTVKVLTNVIGTDFSWPKSKLIVALPLYDKQVYSTFSSGTPVLVALRQGSYLGFNSPQEEARYNVGGATHYVNNDTAFCSKINWALSNGLAGVGLWEITHAYPANAPEVVTLWNTIGGVAACDNSIPTPTPGPTPASVPGNLIDIGNSGTLNNLWGGQWSVAVQCATCSAMVMNYTAAGYPGSLYAAPGPYSIRASGTLNGWVNVSTCLQPACAAYNMDSNGYTRIDFWMKTTPGNYRIAFARTATSGDSDHYGIDFNVPDNNWDFYSFYLADSSQQGWGAAKPKNFTDMKSIVFQPISGFGAFQMNIDDLEAVKQVVTPTPVPPAALLDNVEDGNTTDNWGGAWSSWAPAGSSISAVDAHAAPFPFSTYGVRYSIQANGTNSTALNIGTMSANLNAAGTNVNLSAYNYLSFYCKASSTAGTYGVQFTDSSTFWITVNFNVPADGTWNLVSIPLTALLPTKINTVKTVSWLLNAAGAYTIDLDDIYFENRPPTPTPTNTPSPTISATPSSSSTRTMTATNSPSPSPSPSPSLTVSPSPSSSATRTATATPSLTASITSSNTPLPGSTFTNTVTLTPIVSATFTGTRTSTPANTATSSSTPSNTPGPSGTSTTTPTATFSSTMVSTFTSTPTNVPPGSTLTDTPSISPTNTNTPVASATSTPTVTVLISDTFTPTATQTNTLVSTVPPASTLTWTPSDTATSTGTPTRTATPTFTAVSTPGAMITDVGPMAWGPTSLTVPVGTTVTWAWAGFHGVTSTTATEAYQSSVGANGSFAHQFTSPGDFTYKCIVHGAMMSGFIHIAGLAPTDTPTALPTTGAPTGNLEIVKGAAFPNPSPSSVCVFIAGAADALDVKLYTVSMQCVGHYVLPIVSNGGWITVPLPADYAANLGQGTYYCSASAMRGSLRSLKPWLGKFVFLK